MIATAARVMPKISIRTSALSLLGLLQSTTIHAAQPIIHLFDTLGQATFDSAYRWVRSYFILPLCGAYLHSLRGGLAGGE